MKVVQYKRNKVSSAIQLPEYFTSKEPCIFLERLRSLSNSANEGMEILPECREDALFLISVYVEAIDDKSPVPEILGRYIANGLRDILGGFPIDKDKLEHSFSLRGEQQGAISSFNERNQEMTYKFFDLISDGKTKPQVVAYLADIYHKEPSTIRKILKDNDEEVRFLWNLFNKESADYPEGNQGTPLSEILE